MSLYKKFKVDREAASQGIFVEIGVINEDKTKPKFKLARSDAKFNTKYKEALRDFGKKHGDEIDTMSEEVADEKLLNIFVRTVLIGWENVLDEDEKPIAFSKNNASKLLQELPDLYEILRKKAQEISTFQKEKREEDLKN